MIRIKRLVSLLVLLSASCGVARSQSPVTSERYDNNRTGANLTESSLNTANVNVGQFGKLYSYTVDGSVYAQPLYLPNVTVAGQGSHNVLYVVTMNDVIYAFDADSNAVNSGVLWSLDLRNASAGVTPIPITDIVGHNNGNIVGNVGIESTPVIDINTNTMYLVARTKEVSGSTTSYVARLHALDVTSGAEKFGGPVVITASAPATTTVNFDPLHQNQRASLALANGMVLIAWASHEDLNTWYGWIMAYSAQSPMQQIAAFCTNPGDSEGGVWMSGRAPAVDSSGNVYYATGNGGWDGQGNFGDSVLKFTTTNNAFLMADYFTPDDYANLANGDLDLGSSGPMLIPGTSLVLQGGKESIFYLMNTGNLGQEKAGNDQIVQSFSTTAGEIHGGPVFWNRTTSAGPTMYVWPNDSSLLAYQFSGTTFNTLPISQSSIVAPTGDSGGVLTVSANGSTIGTGIVWASIPLNQDADVGTVEGILRAFDADNLTTELWDSTMDLSRDDMGLWPKYSPPTVENGKVYMASFSGMVNVYGLLPVDFSISATPSPQIVVPGGNTTYTVSAVSQAGFAGSVDLSVTGLPTGATASFSPPSISGPGSSTMTVMAASTTAGGTYTLTITGSNGTLTHSVTVVLIVQSSAGTPISQTGWSLLAVDSQETACGNYAAVNSFDGNLSTFWHTQFCPSAAPLPHQIEINLGATYNVTGFAYLPRQDGCSHGWISQYQFYVSTDGVNWGNPVSSGTFNYGTAVTGCPGASVPSAIQVLFPSTSGRYIQLVALSEVTALQYSSMAEINILATNSAPIPILSSVTLNPTSVVGGSPSQGTVMLTAAAPASGAVVTLTSSNTAAATVPGSVTIASGATSATFTITTSPVGTSTSSTISASYAGVTVPASLGVAPPPVASSVTLSPSSVVGGNSSQGTVTLTAAAPALGAVVTLTSSNTAAATVPASVTVASGATSATFMVTTSSVTTSTSSVISASYGGTTPTATLGVTATPVASSVTLSPTSVVGGNPSQATVTLTAAAPASGAVVTLTSSNTAAATVPASVTIASGATSATFTVTTISVTTSTTSVISASYGGTTQTATLGVQAGSTTTIIPQNGWSLLSVDSQEIVCGNYGAVNSFDGNPATFWHTKYCPSVVALPHQIEINLGASYNIAGFTYLPRQDACSNGWISQYQFYVSTDGVNWGTRSRAGRSTMGLPS